jgi:hypothetical protein
MVLRRERRGAPRAADLSNGMELECELVLVAVGAPSPPVSSARGPPGRSRTGRKAAARGLPSVFAWATSLPRGAPKFVLSRQRPSRAMERARPKQAASVARAILGREPWADRLPTFF